MRSTVFLVLLSLLTQAAFAGPQEAPTRRLLDIPGEETIHASEKTKIVGYKGIYPQIRFSERDLRDDILAQRFLSSSTCSPETYRQQNLSDQELAICSDKVRQYFEQRKQYLEEKTIPRETIIQEQRFLFVPSDPETESFIYVDRIISGTERVRLYDSHYRDIPKESRNFLLQGKDVSGDRTQPFLDMQKALFLGASYKPMRGSEYLDGEALAEILANDPISKSRIKGDFTNEELASPSFMYFAFQSGIRNAKLFKRGGSFWATQRDWEKKSEELSWMALTYAQELYTRLAKYGPRYKNKYRIFLNQEDQNQIRHEKEIKRSNELKIQQQEALERQRQADLEREKAEEHAYQEHVRNVKKEALDKAKKDDADFKNKIAKIKKERATSPSPTSKDAPFGGLTEETRRILDPNHL